MPSLRVAVWSTGWVGSIAVQTIARRPDLDLVGVWVHSPEKVGQDAGTLTGGAPLGIAATGDASALLALQPDCVCYAASDGGVGDGALDDYERMLEAGVNVVTVSTPGLVYPPAYDAATRARLAAAARRGGATLYASGIEPGFAGDQLALTLLTMSRSIRSVRAQEIFLYDRYPVRFTMFEVFGFGQAMDHRPIMALPGVQSGTWGPVVRMVAAGLGVELDGLRETYEREPTSRRLEVASGVVEPGTVGAIRMETIGVVDGRDAIVVEHVNRMAPDVAPHWPSAARDGTYRIVVDGDPSLQCELTVGASPETASDEGMVATTMRIVNAIPLVCAAPPGLVSSLDLPLTLPRGALA
ncbi:MAG TPA: dihydrodipicolinate reductase [Acidimicrobiia bacterium]|nr:dihydrodipicolinate reductase [Acidimicrobiia bacterium]